LPEQALNTANKMKITLILTGKTDDSYIKEGFLMYEKRLKHYIKLETKVIPALSETKNLEPARVKDKEAELQFKLIEDADTVVLLDEKGKEYRSLEFAAFLQQKMNSSVKNLVFIVGGPYGFSEKMYKRANAKMSLSKMTFSHQLVRLLFMEQLYRAFTIIRNEPYHHEG
jgi:23S rRNA (pseudouridine1915-N3)-methyltransferase